MQQQGVLDILAMASALHTVLLALEQEVLDIMAMVLMLQTVPQLGQQAILVVHIPPTCLIRYILLLVLFFRMQFFPSENDSNAY